jgi:hypothetical protein
MQAVATAFVNAIVPASAAALHICQTRNKRHHVVVRMTQWVSVAMAGLAFCKEAHIKLAAGINQRALVERQCAGDFANAHGIQWCTDYFRAITRWTRYR